MEVITLNHPTALHQRRRRRGKIYPILSASSVNQRNNTMEEIPVEMKCVAFEQKSEVMEIENRRRVRYDKRPLNSHTTNESSSLMGHATNVKASADSNNAMPSSLAENLPSLVYGSSTYGSSSSERNHGKSTHTSTPQPWLHRCWVLHFAFAVLVLSIGILDNMHPIKKYLPIAPSLVVDQEGPCSTAYLNVMASSVQERDAIICCPRKNDAHLPHHWIPLETDICTSKSETLPLASRLAKFPEAWLLPLFPILLRLLSWVLLSLWNRFSSPVRPSASISSTIRRFCFYIVVLNFRGWILYVLFNEWEDRWVVEPVSPCWYEAWFAQHSESSICVGRPFDFSDHIVLYYAQLLPIALMETLYALSQNPLFGMISTNADHTMQAKQNTILQVFRNNVQRYLIPIVLIGSHVYLQFITATGAYKTSAYFHTPLEVMAGFAVSMVITVPLYVLQCNTTSYWAAYGRSVLFG